MNRATRVALSSLLACLTCAGGDARAEPVRRAFCAGEGDDREVELRSVGGVAGVCEVVERVVGGSAEERTAYSADARSALCDARFEAAVRALGEAGRRCSVVLGGNARRDVGPFAEAWRSACQAAQAAKNVVGAGALCDCAVGRLRDAGVDERAFEALLSPDDGIDPSPSGGPSDPSDDVGMLAVDAIARCGRP